MKKNIVFYHKNCLDGFSAFWVARKYFKNNADYFGVEPRQLPLKNFFKKTLYFLDTSLSLEEIKKLKEKENKIVIIDHHFSAQKDVRAADEYFFELKHSGAVLAWLYFFKNKPLPRFLAYIEDFDLWRFRLPYAKFLASFVKSLDEKLTVWTKVIKDFENPLTFKEIVRKSKILFKYEQSLIKKCLLNAQKIKVKSYEVLGVNSLLFHSELGYFLAKRKGPFSLVWHFGKDKIYVSLRSKGNFDVSKVTQEFGGGGHKKAAGFVWPLNKKLPWQITY